MSMKIKKGAKLQFPFDNLVNWTLTTERTYLFKNRRPVVTGSRPTTAFLLAMMTMVADNDVHWPSKFFGGIL